MLHRDAAVEVRRFVCGPSANNAYLVACRRTNRSVIIDAPAAPGTLIAAARATEVEALLLTHGHADHLAGLDEVLAALPVPVGIGRADADALLLAGATADMDVSDGSAVRFGHLQLTAIHVPGHTAGSTAFLLPADGGRPPVLFAGDTLFLGGPGRTWSPEGFEQIVESIRERLLTLPDDTRVWPGHGDGTTIGEARREHAAFAGEPRPPGLFGQVRWDDRP